MAEVLAARKTIRYRRVQAQPEAKPEALLRGPWRQVTEAAGPMERRQATEVVGQAEGHQAPALLQPSAQRCQKGFARTDAVASPAWHSTRSSELLESEDIIGFCGCVENS